MNLIMKPSRLLATKEELEAARSGSNLALNLAYIEALEEIAEAALELDKWDYDDLDDLDWGPLHSALGKVYNV